LKFLTFSSKFYFYFRNIADINGRKHKYENWCRELLEVKRSTIQLPPMHVYYLNEEDGKYSLIKIIMSKNDMCSFFIFTFISLVTVSGSTFNIIDIKNSSSMIIYPIILYIIDFVTIVSIGYFIDLPSLGRKTPAIFFSFLTSFLFLCKFICQTYIASDISIFALDLACRISASLCMTILIEYNFEIYSTDIRSNAFNFNQLISHFGDFFTPLFLSYNRNLTTIILCKFVLYNLYSRLIFFRYNFHF